MDLPSGERIMPNDNFVLDLEAVNLGAVAFANPQIDLVDAHIEPVGHPPMILKEEEVEPEQGDSFYFRVRMTKYPGQAPVVELQEVNIEDGWLELDSTLTYAEAIRLHRAIGKVLEHGAENS